jgi:hypothetical protein
MNFRTPQLTNRGIGPVYNDDFVAANLLVAEIAPRNKSTEEAEHSDIGWRAHD